MTAAFALGQLAGPLISGLLDMRSADPVAALSMALQLAAIGLTVSAMALWRLSRIAPDERSAKV